MDVAVVGAGVAGLASAIALQRIGARVTVFEQRSEPATGGAGLLLQPSGLAALEALDGPILPHMPAIKRLEGRRPDGKCVLDLAYGRYPGGHGHGVVRADLVEGLARTAATLGVRFHFGDGVGDVAQDAEGARLSCCHDRRWDLVVVADGAHSLLRAAVSASDRSHTYDWAALWALVDLPSGWPLDVLHQRYERADRMAGVLPVRSAPGQPAVGTFFWSIRRDQVVPWREAPLDQWRDAVVRMWPELEPVVGGFRTHDDLHCATYRDVRVRRSRQGRVVLVGDAAHGTSPQLGNGANLALGDAVMLGRALQQAPDVAGGLRRYERERRRAVRYYQWASRVLTPFFQSESRILPRARDLMLDHLCRAPIVGRYMHSTLCGDRMGWFSNGLIADLGGAPLPECEHQAGG